MRFKRRSWTQLEFPSRRRCKLGTLPHGAVFEFLERRDLLSAAAIPTPDHVVIVMEENRDYGDIIGNSAAPYINSLANGPDGALFTQSFALQHPSQPNYLDLFSGSNQGVNDDNVPTGLPFTTANLGAELIARGDSFTGYSEDLPSVGFTGATSGEYARKHNPWVNWQDSTSNSIPATDNQPFSSFPTDFSTLPTVSFVIPNLQDDMHDGSTSAGDQWLHDHLDAYAQWASTHNSLLIVTFDEDDGSQVNQIPTLFVGQMVSHAQYSETINHFDVLRTIEEMYGLPYAGASAGATPIGDIWQGSAPTFAQQGSILNVTGTSAADQISLNVDPNDGSQFSVTVNDATNSYSTSAISEVDLQGGAGGDKVILSDPVNSFQATLSLNNGSIERAGFQAKVTGAASLYVYGNTQSTAQVFDGPAGSLVSATTYGYTSGSGYFDLAANFGSFYGYAGGANDVASLYSSAGDAFVATSSYAYTSDPTNHQFFNVAEGFQSLYAYGSSSGGDTAYLYSAAGDWFVASPTYSYLTDPAGHSFFDVASGFHTLYAYASAAGTDAAFLYSGAGGEFVATLQSAYLSGANYFAVADNFHTVNGYSSGAGTDAAFFYLGSNENFVGGSVESYVSSAGVLIVANGFQATYGNATPGAADVADLYDSPGDDHLLASGATATLFAADGTYVSVDGFDTVTSHQSAGNDTEHVDAVFFHYQKTGTWTDI